MMPVKVKVLDHLVLTVKHIPTTINWYQRYLGMKATTFVPLTASSGTPPRHALLYGSQKINLHEAGKEFEPKAKTPGPGTADICFEIETVEKGLEGVKSWLQENGVPIEQGIVQRTGARGRINSIYVRDPDGNLVELSQYDDPSLLSK